MILDDNIARAYTEADPPWSVEPKEDQDDEPKK